MSHSVLAFIVAFLALGFIAQRDIRRELYEIYANVLVPSARWSVAVGKHIASIRFGLRHLFMLTTAGAVFFALVHYLGRWTLLLLPVFFLVGLDLYRGKFQKE